jgi:hypothetical protein
MHVVTEPFSIGSRVRVVKSVVIYHHPEHRNQPFDLDGQEGELIGIVREWEGRPVSANLPFLVKFSPKLKVHLQASELEAVN